MLIETPRVAAIFYVASAKWLLSHLSSRSAGNLRIAGLIVSFLWAASPLKNSSFPSCFQSLRIMVLSVLAEFRLAVGMPGTHRKVGKAQQLHLTSPLMCCESEWWRERKCVCMESGRKKHEEQRAYGWKDRQREAWMYAVRNVCTQKARNVKWRIQ